MKTDLLLEYLNRENVEELPEWLHEKVPTLHWCICLDYLVIDHTCPEWEFCSCFSKETYKKYPKMKEIDLYLTPQQAKTLFIVMRQIGGSPRSSLRKYTDEILHMLRLLEFQFDPEELIEKHSDSVYFKDDTLGAVE